MLSMPEPSPLPWSVRDSTVSTQLYIVAANGLIVATVHATSRGKKMPKRVNAELIIKTANRLIEHGDKDAVCK